MQVYRFSPGTQLQSEITGEIEVTRTREKQRSLGVAVRGNIAALDALPKQLPIVPIGAAGKSQPVAAPSFGNNELTGELFDVFEGLLRRSL